MLRAIPRYGVRVASNTERIVKECRRKGQLIQGPHIHGFENAFARRLGGGIAITASYGRMAFYYILRALQLPPDSEIIIPALTSWVVPEIARVAGCRPVFADVDPDSFTLDPKALERAITPRTRAVVPSHLYGLPCDMDAIMEISKRRKLHVIEDCAHALGAKYRGREVGTFGDASFFSFQASKPLNAYGGGIAFTKDTSLASRIVSIATEAAWPHEQSVRRRLLRGRLQRLLTHPTVFTLTSFPILWSASFSNSRRDPGLREPIRSLNPLPTSYSERFSNVQAALALSGLDRVDEWNAQCRQNAGVLTAALKDIDGVSSPQVPDDRTHIYYQYCVYVPGRDAAVAGCIRRGIDVEALRADVCTTLAHFQETLCEAPGAERAAQVVQLPAYASLTARQMSVIAKRVRQVLIWNPKGITSKSTLRA